MQHLKWASLELLLDLRSLHLFCTSFTLEMGLIKAMALRGRPLISTFLVVYDEVWSKCIEVLIKCALPADVGAEVCELPGLQDLQPEVLCDVVSLGVH